MHKTKTKFLNKVYNIADTEITQKKFSSTDDVLC